MQHVVEQWFVCICIVKIVYVEYEAELSLI